MIEQLPYEIRSLLYLRYLDIFDLRNLLRAFPRLRHEILIVSDTPTDAPLRPTFFRDIGDVKICRLETYRKLGGRRNRKFHDFAVTVFELIDPRHLLGFHNSFLTSGDPSMDKILNAYSIVYLQLPFAEPESMTTVLYLKSICPQVYVDSFEIKVCPSQLVRRWDSSIYTPNTFRQSISSSKLNILEICGCNQIFGLQFPTLRELTIRFYGDAVPSIRNVRANKVRKFSLFYDRRFPNFKHVQIGYNNGARQRTVFDRSKITVVRLIHTRALCSNLTAPLPPCLTSNCFVEGSLQTIVQNFLEAHVIGGPDGLLNEVMLPELYTLYWKRANYQLGNTSIHVVEPKYCSRLDTFHFETTVPHTVIPAFRFKRLTSLNIVSYDPWLDISAFCNTLARRGRTESMYSVLVHSYCQDSEGKMPLELPLSLVSKQYSMQWIDLYGCVFPEECSRLDSNDDLYWGEARWMNMKGPHAELDNDPSTPLRMGARDHNTEDMVDWLDPLNQDPVDQDPLPDLIPQNINGPGPTPILQRYLRMRMMARERERLERLERLDQNIADQPAEASILLWVTASFARLIAALKALLI